MSTQFDPYINRSPGDLVTAEDWNEIQRRIKADIGKQIADAISAIEQVPESENSLKLQDQSADDLTQSILEKARQELPKRTGYQRLFLRLRAGEEKVVEHKLGGCPLTDLYRLETFPVVCSEDEQKSREQVIFYFYTSRERKQKYTPVGAQVQSGSSIEIERTGSTQFRISFAELLAFYNVKYTDRSTLEDLETEFWQAFLAPPNDDFDDDQYCHSPAVDECCGQRRTVHDLKSSGLWDELWLKLVPRKTVNMANPAPQNVEIFHYDFNKLGLRYTQAATPTAAATVSDAREVKDNRLVEVDEDTAGTLLLQKDETPQRVEEGILNVMLLLKV
jgi:hypothetical protein